MESSDKGMIDSYQWVFSLLYHLPPNRFWRGFIHLAAPSSSCSMQALYSRLWTQLWQARCSSRVRDWTQVPCIRMAESEALDHQGSPLRWFLSSSLKAEISSRRTLSLERRCLGLRSSRLPSPMAGRAGGTAPAPEPLPLFPSPHTFPLSNNHLNKHHDKLKLPFPF